MRNGNLVWFPGMEHPSTEELRTSPCRGCVWRNLCPGCARESDVEGITILYRHVCRDLGLIGIQPEIRQRMEGKLTASEMQIWQKFLL